MIVIKTMPTVYHLHASPPSKSAPGEHPGVPEPPPLFYVAQPLIESGKKNQRSCHQYKIR